jgi:hypothetical protein
MLTWSNTRTSNKLWERVRKRKIERKHIHVKMHVTQEKPIYGISYIVHVWFAWFTNDINIKDVEIKCHDTFKTIRIENIGICIACCLLGRTKR